MSKQLLIDSLREMLETNGFKPNDKKNYFTKNNWKRDRSITIDPKKKTFEVYEREYPASEGWYRYKKKITTDNLKKFKDGLGFLAYP
jgi:hypothetical protein